MMKRLLLTASAALALTEPTFAIDMSMVEAMVKECRTTAICPCPRAKIRRVDMKTECGEIPAVELDQYGNWTNKAQSERQGKCMKEVLDANEKIDAYNSIFATCQNPYVKNSNVKGKVIPVPGSHPTYSSEGKTLLEQAHEAYQGAHPQEEQRRRREQAEQPANQQAREDQRPAPRRDNCSEMMRQCIAGVTGGTMGFIPTPCQFQYNKCQSGGGFDKIW